MDEWTITKRLFIDKIEGIKKRKEICVSSFVTVISLNGVRQETIYTKNRKLLTNYVVQH